MQVSRRSSLVSRTLIIAVSCIVMVFFGLILANKAGAQSVAPEPGQRLITVHDGGTERGLLTRATTLREAFGEAGITVDPRDLIEPGLDERLEANNYEVNIYRARPVTIVDGNTYVKVMSPHRTAKQIAREADIILQDEDITELKANTDIVSQGAGVHLEVTRATEFTLVLYGKMMVSYTQAETVAAMLEEKDIILGADDTLSVTPTSPIKPGITVEIWRNGIQTVTEEEEVPFDTEKVRDMDREIGYREVKTKGKPGARVVTYEVEMEDGRELSRKKIQSVMTKEPKKQIEIVGGKPKNGLTKSKGAHYFVDSRGVSHRETYYDLPMNVVMQFCGGGTYSVREDGAKVDQDGYILVAANLSRYPRCSIVETSLGEGRVYDTGGFAAVHPDGFDLATDWTNYDGR